MGARTRSMALRLGLELMATLVALVSPPSLPYSSFVLLTLVAILQTGVEFLVEGTQTSYEAWYEWYPDYSHTFTGFAVKPGDSIRTTVKATSLVAGTATVENLTTGKSVSHTFSNEGSLGSLCQTNAEWIVEDFESGSALVPFANFGSVSFTGASYVTGGSTKGVTGASILDVKQGNTVETNCALSGSSGVTCQYV